MLIGVLYVDDLLIIGPNEQEIADFKADHSKTFELTDLDHLHYYFSIQFITVQGAIFFESKKLHREAPTTIQV